MITRRVDVRLGDGGVNANLIALLNALFLCIPQKYAIDLGPRLSRDPLDAMSERRLSRGLVRGGKAAKPLIRIRVCQMEGRGR